MRNIIEQGTKANFFRGNQDLFLQYFDSLQQYQALINAGNFQKMQEIIKSKSNFNVEKFINQKN